MASLAIAGKLVMRDVPPGVLILARVGGAATVLAIAHRVAGFAPVRSRSDLGMLAVLGLLGVTSNQSLFLVGLRHTTAINATILVTTVPMFTVLLSLLLRRETASVPKIAGILVAAAAAVYLIGPDRISLAPDLALGNALILVAMMAYSLYFIYASDLLHRYRTLTISFYVMLFGALGAIPYGVYSLQTISLSQIRPVVWLLIVYIVIFPTILAYFLNIWALRRVSSNLVAVFVYLQPVFTAITAPFLLSGEAVTQRALLAAMGIFTGVGLVIWAERRERREVPMESPVGE